MATPRTELDAEAAVLSACILKQECIDDVLPILPSGDPFFNFQNRFWWEALLELHAESSPIDSVTLGQRVNAKGRLAAAGGPAYLSELIDATPSVQNVKRHAELVREAHIQRQVVDLCHKIAAEGYGDVGSVSEWVDRRSAELAALSDSGTSSTMATLRDALVTGVQGIEDATKTNPRSVRSGLRDLDALTGGFAPGDMVVIAGRPGMGKTAFAFQIAEAEAMRGNWVLFMSLEMTKVSLAMRAMCSHARVDNNILKSTCIGPDQWRDLTEAATQLAVLPITIDDGAAQTPAMMRAKARALAASAKRSGHRLGCVVVDYLQLLDGRQSSNAKANREQEVAHCSRQMKAIAKDLGVPVIALAQLSRPQKGSKVHRPQLTDLRESGQIEQDADTVIFIHREEYYLLGNTPQEKRGVAELIVAKQRSGATGVVECSFFDYCTLFGDRKAES